MNKKILIVAIAMLAIGLISRALVGWRNIRQISLAVSGQDPQTKDAKR